MEAKTFEDNRQIYKNLSGLIIDRYIPSRGAPRKVNLGPLEINDFSICFAIDIHDNVGSQGVYVKIPKVDLYKKKTKEIMPLSDEDRKFAQDEYRSLVQLSRYWHSQNISVTFIKPLGFLEEYSAIVTERAYAGYLFKIFRRWDLARRFRQNDGKDYVDSILSRIGTALSEFHKNSLQESAFNVEKTLSKIECYSHKLLSFGADRKLHDKIKIHFSALKGFMPPTQVTNTIKGLDIRNILTDKDGNVFLLDPGLIKEDHKEADLARFLVTCRILYWGSFAFFLRLHPNRSYEESFLSGYFGKNKRSTRVLTILSIKELLKHWYLAHVALQLKWWPKPFKSFLRKFYIDPFYERQITNELTYVAKSI